jgi:hypothetical protein
MAHIIDDLIDQELILGNRVRCFYLTRLGELLDGRFKTMAQLGFGASSIV